MKIDTGFWRKDGTYIENIEDLELEDYNEILLDENKRLQAENERLKSELHFKTEYIQEQRDIIEQYRKEIKMYKKCQGKRASKRETELRKALEEIRGILCKGRTFYDGYFENENLSRTDKAIKVISEVLDER